MLCVNASAEQVKWSYLCRIIAIILELSEGGAAAVV